MPHFVPITYAVLLDQSDRDMKIPTSKNAGAHTLLEKLRERGAQTGKEPEEETEKAGGGGWGRAITAGVASEPTCQPGLLRE